MKKSNKINKHHSWEAKRTSAALTTICCLKLIELLVYVESLSNVFGRQFPGNFSGNSLIENAQNQCAPTKRSFVASAEPVTYAEVNALVMPRPSLLYPVMTRKCVLALILVLACGFS